MSDAKPTLVAATAADLPTVSGFMGQLYADDDVLPDEALWSAALRDLLAEPSWGCAWLIRYRGQVVGYVVVTFGYSLEFSGRDAFVDELYIEAAHRGLGIGTAIMKLVEAEVRTLGIRALHLEVEEDNQAAQRLYEAQGYRYRRHMHLMSKRLDKPVAGPS